MNKLYAAILVSVGMGFFCANASFAQPPHKPAHHHHKHHHKHHVKH